MTRIAIGIVVLMLIGASCSGNGGTPIARPTAEPPEDASTGTVTLSPTAIGAGSTDLPPITTQGSAQPVMTPPSTIATATPGPTQKPALFTGTGNIATSTLVPAATPEPTSEPTSISGAGDD